MRTEYPFVLPKGYVDDQGQSHRRGTMRLATARDEIDPLRDPRVRGADDPLLTLIVLSRVVTQLGPITHVSTHEIESLFAADLAYLQDFYGIVNFGTDAEIAELLRDQDARLAAEREAARPAPMDDADDSEPIRRRRHAIEEVPSAER